MKIIVATCLSVFFAVTAQASSVSDAKITEVRSGTWYGQKVTFKVSPSPTLPACNTLESRGHYVIDLSKQGSNAWLSMILSAKAAQTNVQVWGTDSCISINGFKGEELETIAIQ
ncbi:hypothetical protein A3759_12165 [Thalassolituus sp. HI0120]|nr:hypothetical protein A3759_12165 [Thalassolituus sp. HI0120]